MFDLVSLQQVPVRLKSRFTPDVLWTYWTLCRCCVYPLTALGQSKHHSCCDWTFFNISSLLYFSLLGLFICRPPVCGTERSGSSCIAAQLKGLSLKNLVVLKSLRLFGVKQNGLGGFDYSWNPIYYGFANIIHISVGFFKDLDEWIMK